MFLFFHSRLLFGGVAQYSVFLNTLKEEIAFNEHTYQLLMHKHNLQNKNIYDKLFQFTNGKLLTQASDIEEKKKNEP